MKLPNKLKIIKDFSYSLLAAVLIFTCCYYLYVTYGITNIAAYEFEHKAPLFTTKRNDCRIDNLNALGDDSNGTGKILFLQLIDNTKKESFHLITCDSKENIIDKNGIIKQGKCNFDTLNFIDTKTFISYKKMGELIVLDFNIVKEKTFSENIDFLNNYFTVPIQGIEYSKVYLKLLQEKKRI